MTELRVGQIWVDSNGRHAQILGIDGPFIQCHTWFDGDVEPARVIMGDVRFIGNHPGDFQLVQEAETDADS